MTKMGQKGQFLNTINPLQQINENELKDKTPKKDKLKPLTKVVIRKLPPSMTEETFLKQIEPLPDHEYYYFVPADWSLGQNSTSRAYISFINQSDIFSFKDRFDGYVFIDNRTGSEYPAIVEFAPFQCLLKPKCRKNDPKCNTIESDPCYISFLEKCQNEIKKASSTIDFKLEFFTSHRNDKKNTSTPLLQYLANKKQEKKDDRKRRHDQKRRQQDEERKRKRRLAVKSLPPTITEEEYKDNKKDKDKNFNKKNKERHTPMDKNDFIAKRKLERDQNRRQEKQERNFSDNRNRKQQQDQGISCAKNVKILSSTSKINEKESFKENSNSNVNECTGNLSSFGRNINSNVNKKTTSQNEINENVRKFIMNASSIIQNTNESKSVTSSPSSSIPSNKCEKSSKKINTSDFSKSSYHGKNDEKQRKDEKTSRRIRNKDRPSIEIYQPGKMRLNSNKNDNRSNKSGSDDGRYKRSVSSDNDNTRKETINNYNTSNIDDNDITKPIGKKVSRYSERRLNHAKEREEYAKKLSLNLKNVSEESSDQVSHP